MAADLKGLEAERRRLYGKLSEIGDFRRGSIAENYRRCGRANCACSQAEHSGHGPQYLLMTKVGGRSRAQNLRPGAELNKARQEVATHRSFRHLVQEIVGVNEQLCAARPIEPSQQATDRARLKKKSPRSSRRRSHGKSKV